MHPRSRPETSRTSSATRLASLLGVLLALGAPTPAQTFRVTLPENLKAGNLSAGPAGDVVVAYTEGAGSDVFALDAAGGLRWSTRVETPSVPTSSWSKVLAMPDGGALVARRHTLTRLGPDGSVLGAHALPLGGSGTDQLVVRELDRLSDGRVVAVASGTLETGPLVVFEVGDSGAATSFARFTTSPTSAPSNHYGGVGSVDLAPTSDGGWVMKYDLTPWDFDDTGATYLVRCAADGSALWSLEVKSPTNSSAVAVLTDGRIVASWAKGLLVVGSGGQPLEKLEFTDPVHDTAAGLVAAPGGGLYAFRGSNRIQFLGPDLQPVWARELPGIGLFGFGREPLHRTPDGALLLWASQSESVVLRLTHDGQLLGACASEVGPDSTGVVDAPLIDVQGTGVVASAPFVASSGAIAAQAGLAPAAPVATCSDPLPRVTAQGGQVGGSLGFLHEQPCCPGGLSLLVLGASGTGSLPLPNGLDVGVVLDPLGLALLQVPSLSFALLDGSGTGSTASLAVPPDPGLVGAVLTYAALGFDVVTSQFEQITVPASVVLQ